ncbi:MAG: insulinase family protein [Clostridia bacterium]|jgi:predicted Zn-dependent peptidase|nr:insulinase family protein [Clostridia bacterium]
MSEWKEIQCRHTGEKCYFLQHASGLPIYVWPKAGYASAYAVFAAKYGSIDTAYVCADTNEVIELPAGIAHYLEHKLFENEDCDAFERYAKTGASANAYTSFDQTAYLFSCTRGLSESLEILLDFVQKPYFTEKTVEKERGIIGQEIRMCEDSPARAVFCNLLEGLYHTHPVRIDIAGTVESIAEITPELLYGCYHRFYNLHNMVLSVAGNVTCEQVEELADRLLVPTQPYTHKRAPVNEPPTAYRARTEVSMPVSETLFYLGYKVPQSTENGLSEASAEELAAAAVLQELLGGRANPLYARLMSEGLINASFGIEYFDGPGYGVWIIGGESKDPDAVCEAFRKERERMDREGVSAEEFDTAKKAVYGQMISHLDNVEGCGDMAVDAHFSGRKPFDLLDAVANLERKAVQKRLREDFSEAAASVSIVNPIMRGEE